MDQTQFLQTISNYTLVNYSLLKRLFHEENLKDIKTLLKHTEQARLVNRHVFQGFDCFSLTSLGFQTIGVDHAPQYHRFTRNQANQICRVNHLRIGFERELARFNNLHLKRWFTGGSFSKRPLSTRFNNAEQFLKPHGLAMVSFPNDIDRLYFIHYWQSMEQIDRDLFFYFLYQTRNEHAYRFRVSPETGLRVLCLVPSYKTVYEVLPRLENIKGEAITLFIPESKVHVDHPLESQIWLTCHGRKRSVL
ncbi:MAG: hypothetical protein HQM11_13570 [SAR324 cluster bacterium]|nr:hypothetical protein [SAR324 cluster bacterium]